MDIKLDKVQGIIRDDDYPASEQWQLVGQRCGQNGQLSSASGSPFRNSHSKHLFPSGADAIQLVYSGCFLQAAKPGEKPYKPSVFSADSLTFSGGTGYVVGEVLTFVKSDTGALDAIKVIITAVSSGVPTQAQILDGGIYNLPLSGSTGATINVSSITRSGSVATVTTETSHGLVSGRSVLMAGAGQSQYNGAKQITVVDATTFTYAVSGTPATPATGTITCTDSITQVSSTGSGTGLVCIFNWKGYAYGGHISVETGFNNQNFTGIGAIQFAKKGIKADGKIDIKVLVPMGGIWKSDIIPVDIPIGGSIGIRSSLGWQTATTDFQFGRLPMLEAFGHSQNLECAAQSNTWYDLATSGTMPATSSTYMWQPSAIMGIPKKKLPTIVCVGDSLMAGNASGIDALTSPPLFDKMDDDGNIGPFEKALNIERGCFYPWANFSKGGQQLDRYLGNSPQGQFGRQNLLDLIMLIKPTAVFQNLNFNDFGTALLTPAQVLAFETQLVQEIRGCGVKYVFTSTTSPCTASTDHWATLENQTLRGSNISSSILTRNQMLAAGTWTAGYDFYIDNRATTESTPDSGKWKVNGEEGYATDDGIHASPYIIGLQADGIAEAIKSHIPIS